jgi:S-formylglutathione hydrolase FrmB
MAEEMVAGPFCTRIEIMTERRPHTLLFLVITLLSLHTGAAAQVTVVSDSIYAPSISGYCAYRLLLPDGYARSVERYPALYLLHGFNQDQNSWINSSRLVEHAARISWVIVLPDAKNSWYTNAALNEQLKYEDLLIKDIIPAIERKYRVRTDRASRAVAGLSMGGYGALKYGLKYPAMFSFAAALSPSIQFPAGLEDSAIVARRSAASNASVRAAFGEQRNSVWYDNDIFELLKRPVSGPLPYFYLSVGSQDGIPEVIDQTHELARILRAKKIPFEMHESPGGHDWHFWDSEIPTVLSKLPTRTPR